MRVLYTLSSPKTILKQKNELFDVSHLELGVPLSSLGRDTFRPIDRKVPED